MAELRRELHTELDLARRLLDRRDFARATLLCESILSRDPRQRVALELLTQSCVQQGELGKATNSLETLIQLHPDDAKYYTKLAEISLRTGSVGSALRACESLIEVHPASTSAHYFFARVLAAVGQSYRALEEYQACLDLGTEHPEDIMVCQAKIHAEQDRREEAFRLLHTAVERRTDCVPALFNLATLSEESGDRETAIALYSRVIELQPTFTDAFERLANAGAFQDRNDPRLLRMMEALRDQGLAASQRESLYFGLGKALDDCGEHELAFEQYRAGNDLARHRARPYDAQSTRRAVDDLIEIFNPAFLDSIPRVGNCRQIFIAGMFRSGSTLLEQMLASHPRVCSGGEIGYFPRLGDRELAHYPDSLRSVSGDFLHEIGLRYLDFCRERFGSADILTNKRPDNLAYLGLIKTLYPDARIICTERHALDNALSVYFTRLDAHYDYASRLEDIGHYLVQSRRMVAHWERLFGGDILVVNYDALVRSPESQLRRVLNFCGLDWDDTCMSFYESDRVVRTASLWQVRRPLHGNSSGRWRNYRRHVEKLITLFQDAGIRFDETND